MFFALGFHVLPATLMGQCVLGGCASQHTSEVTSRHRCSFFTAAPPLQFSQSLQKWYISLAGFLRLNVYEYPHVITYYIYTLIIYINIYIYIYIVMSIGRYIGNDTKYHI